MGLLNLIIRTFRQIKTEPVMGSVLLFITHILFKIFLKVLVAQRTREIVSLNVIAVVVAQKFKFFLSLDTLRNSFDPHIVAHRNNGSDYFSYLAVFLDLANKAHVNFKNVKIVVLNHAERRISAAKVVKVDLMSPLTDIPYERLKFLLKRSVRCFRDLVPYRAFRKYLFFKTLVEVGNFVLVLKLDSRKVH